MDNINKDILEQYCAMQQEARDLRRRIEEGERYLEKSKEEGYLVADTVTGSRPDLTIGPIKVTGFPFPEYERVKKMTRQRIAKLQILEDDLLEATNKVDDFINAIPKSELRMMFRFYYLDDLTWHQVARRMSSLFPKKKYTEDSCRKRHDRYLEKSE